MKKEHAYYDVLIIGGGPGGVYGGYLAHNKGLKALLVEATNNLGGQPLTLYSQKSIYDYPGMHGIKGYALSEALIEQLKHHSKTEVLLNTTVTNFKKCTQGFIVTLTNNTQVKVGAIIIAVGDGVSIPNKLETHIKDNPQIHYVVNNLKTYYGKKVVILGGGDAAVDWANELVSSKTTDHVAIVHRRDEFRAIGTNVKQLSNNNVKTYMSTLVQEITKNEVILNNQEHIAYDYVIVQYGQSIDKSWKEVFKTLKMTPDHRIPVDVNQSTSIDHVYAIGNACTYQGKPSSIIAAHGEIAVAIRDIINKKNQK